MMHTGEALIDYHERAHGCLEALLAHCRQLDAGELHRELPGFGYATVQLQLHHVIGAQQYWIGVLEGRVEADDDAPDYPTVASLEAYRGEVYLRTKEYLQAVSPGDLNAARMMMTWGNKEKLLVPAHVFMRTLAHIFQHQGQITAMCRLMGKPVNGLDYPVI